jgi:uncharacterized membrane protein YphA (DoxX/SURF4 family)
VDFLNKYTSQLLGVTRIVIGLLFLEHGTAKVLSFPWRRMPRRVSLTRWRFRPGLPG